MSGPSIPGRTYSRGEFLRLAALGAGVTVVSAACGSGTSATGSSGKSGSSSGGGSSGAVTISLATGISYASLIIIRAKKWLEHDLPHRTINWKVINGGAVTRDGLLSGSLQAGASGVGPYLIGWDRGVPW